MKPLPNGWHIYQRKPGRDPERELRRLRDRFGDISRRFYWSAIRRRVWRKAQTAAFYLGVAVIGMADVSESIKTVTGVSEFAQRAMLVVGLGLLVAALLLILNAIRMAMFARRREIEVMKLVGATNWFIRVPFMLEGIVQGIVGAGLALVAVFALDRFMQSAAENEDYKAIMEGFVATSGELMWTVR